VITDVSLLLGTHVPRMHLVIRQRIRLIGQEICHPCFHVGKADISLCCLVSIASHNFILVLPTYDCVVKLCNPYTMKLTIKLTPYMLVI
jgi:hypothetical protein